VDASWLALIVTGLTLIVTIVGWIVTYRLQRQILERQLLAERERDVRQLIIPARLDELRNLRRWFQEGMKYQTHGKAVFSQQDKYREYSEWSSRGKAEVLFAAIVEGKAFYDAIKQIDSLANLTQTFLTGVNDFVIKGGFMFEGDLCERALARIDALEKEIAQSDVM
jgi:hypothetical protein